MAEVKRSDLPTIEDDTRPFWDAAKEGRFLVRKCKSCSAIHHYPRQFCPECWSGDVEWLEVSGKGTLYTWSTVFANDLPPFKDKLPYIAAVVDLAEGPRVMTNLVDCTGDELAIGMNVEVKYQDLTEDIVIPVFTPTK